MANQSKIYLLKDRKDYVKKLTDDKIINIIGTKGSGKTTSANKYIDNDNYLVINCDRLYDMPTDNALEDDFLPKVKELLIKKYGEIYTGEKFEICYDEIVSFAKENKKNIIIEGNVIYDIKPITKLKGTVVAKRTGVLKCFLRAVKRDYPTSYFLKLEIEKYGPIMGRISRLKNIIKRRKSIFKEYHTIENDIEELEEYVPGIR